MAALRRIAADSEKLSEVLADLDEGLAHPARPSVAAKIEEALQCAEGDFAPPRLLNVRCAVSTRLRKSLP